MIISKVPDAAVVSGLVNVIVCDSVSEPLVNVMSGVVEIACQPKEVDDDRRQCWTGRDQRGARAER